MTLFPYSPQRSPTAPRSTLKPQLLSRFGGQDNVDDAWDEAEAAWKEHLTFHESRLAEAAQHRRDIRQARINRDSIQPRFRPGMEIMLKDIHLPLGVNGKLVPARSGPWSIIEVDDDSHTLLVADEQGDVLPRRVPFDHARLWTPDAAFQGGRM